MRLFFGVHFYGSKKQNHIFDSSSTNAPEAKLSGKGKGGGRERNPSPCNLTETVKENFQGKHNSK